jgi:hypothetical protein
MNRKGGRPKKHIKAWECRADTGFTKSEFFVVREKASKAGLKLGPYLRVMAINGKIQARLTEEQWGYMRRLIDMSKDLHKLNETAEQQGALYLSLDFRAYRDRIDEIIKLLKHAD